MHLIIAAALGATPRAAVMLHMLSIVSRPVNRLGIERLPLIVRIGHDDDAVADGKGLLDVHDASARDHCGTR